MNIDNLTGDKLHGRAEILLAEQGKHDSYTADEYGTALAAAEAEVAEAELDPEALRAERSRLENGLAEFAWTNLTRVGVEITAERYLGELERLIALIERGRGDPV